MGSILKLQPPLNINIFFRPVYAAAAPWSILHARMLTPQRA
jgi:hypothetical protein